MRELGKLFGEPFGGYLGGLRLGGGDHVVRMVTTSTAVAWSPTTVTKAGAPLIWRVYDATGVQVLEQVAVDPTFNLSPYAGAKTVRVTSPDGWAGLTALNLIGLELTYLGVDPAYALTQLEAPNNASLAFSRSAVSLPPTLLFLVMYSTQSLLTGSLADLPRPLLILDVGGTPSALTGSLSDLPPSLAILALYGTNCALTGSLSDLPATMESLLLSATPSAIAGGGAIAATGIKTINVDSTGRTQAQVDEILAAVYANRMAFTYATPVLNVAGSNAAPSGVYQAAAPPTTGKEYAYALENPGGGGWIAWNVVFTA